ncbi:hypothetical protein ES319_D13G083200v1 [Gossypium barbadense]|uniref:Uncharacterized protein n=2 Tax=Gossypium TaxID=3633 RepID=A0A5J5NJD2_GOSBA|nr:hypothetical protein ES319_D13G083200v1 [Gossypium barbadense]KAB1994196.1 hypothetical protein ES319_D13G083200v1 [Gossypium barbadense]TYG36755.1 hypothetical protein ES288_D13G088800v1 [Gossypium darwinii]
MASFRWSVEFGASRNGDPQLHAMLVEYIYSKVYRVDNLVGNLLGDFEYEVQDKYLLYRNASQEINGIWFYDAHELEDGHHGWSLGAIIIN